MTNGAAVQVFENVLRAKCFAGLPAEASLAVVADADGDGLLAQPFAGAAKDKGVYDRKVSEPAPPAADPQSRRAQTMPVNAGSRPKHRSIDARMA